MRRASYLYASSLPSFVYTELCIVPSPGRSQSCRSPGDRRRGRSGTRSLPIIIANAEQLRKLQRLSKIGTRPFSSVARLYWNLKGMRRTAPIKRTPIARTKSFGTCPSYSEGSGVRQQKKGGQSIPSYTTSTRNDAALSPYGPCERLRTRCGICPKHAAWKRTRLLRRVPVKLNRMAPACPPYGTSENRSPLDNREDSSESDQNLSRTALRADSDEENHSFRAEDDHRFARRRCRNHCGAGDRHGSRGIGGHSQHYFVSAVFALAARAKFA